MGRARIQSRERSWCHEGQCTDFKLAEGAVFVATSYLLGTVGNVFARLLVDTVSATVGGSVNAGSALVVGRQAERKYLVAGLAGATIDHQSILERAGSLVGPYRLVEQIGEGGFGLVFLAQQTENNQYLDRSRQQSLPVCEKHSLQFAAMMQISDKV